MLSPRTVLLALWPPRILDAKPGSFEDQVNAWRLLVSSLLVLLLTGAAIAPNYFVTRSDISMLPALQLRQVRADLRQLRILQCRVPNVYKASYQDEIEYDMDTLYHLTGRVNQLPSCEQLGVPSHVDVASKERPAGK